MELRNKKIKVKVWRDGYYPCGYQLQAIRDDITESIITTTREGGSPVIDDKMAVCDDIDNLPLSPQQRKDLSEGWDITILIDPWELAHFYGYDSHTIFEG